MPKFNPYCSVAAVAFLLGACATTPTQSPLPTAQVTASGETVAVGTVNDDAADDPAIWRNAANPT
jgi:3-phytase